MRSDTGTHEQFECSAASVAGIRPVNEDAWCTAQVGGGLVCAVADGIGGHEAGDVASALAIRVFGETVHAAQITSGDHDTAAAVLMKGHTLAHEAIRHQAIGTRAGMGTTLVSAWFGDGAITMCNTGDSRCTLIRKGIVLRLTKDHSFVQDLVDKGVLTPEEAMDHPMKNIITHSLGGDFIADCTAHFLCPNDTLVLSSDGLHDYVSRQALVAAGAVPSADDAVKILLEEAARKSTDNITLIVVRVHGEAKYPEECE
ncbi:protein phosphatase 2C domain-containing protein [Methanogenium sp. S4BF]|uniref:PP2C family protein-serine/threonine phosphatase n=1 Tax=Methanogenium sp. S4BF TaxID=1789226 RepID=UPI002415E72E|nr:protein phosphatase 2C domain-containing protein [Methanogenium sp. S4BF]WFN35658.1 protein phosphatase 2C domain-containing protein [Methanogenium sp. S4BF]